MISLILGIIMFVAALPIITLIIVIYALLTTR